MENVALASLATVSLVSLRIYAHLWLMKLPSEMHQALAQSTPAAKLRRGGWVAGPLGRVE